MKKGGAGIVLVKEGLTYEKAFLEFLDNSTWKILDNSTLTSMIIECTINLGYESPFMSSRANNFNLPIDVIIFKMMVCSSANKSKMVELPSEFRRGKFSNRIEVVSKETIINEARIQNDICFKTSIKPESMLNGLAPCILGLSLIEYEDLFLDQTESINYLDEYRIILDKEDPNSSMETEELQAKMISNINLSLIKNISPTHIDEFSHFLYIVNFVKHVHPEEEISLCIFGMEFLKGYLTQFNTESQVTVNARINSKKLVAEKNKKDMQSFNLQKQSLITELGEQVFKNSVENHIKDNNRFETTFYNQEISKFKFHIALNILWSIVSLHSVGYVHNDFHSNNVFLYLKLLNNNQNEDDVIIIDFGKTREIKEKQEKMLNDYTLKDYIKKYNLKQLFVNTNISNFLNYHAPYSMDVEEKDDTSIEENALIESENESKYKNLLAFLIGNLIIELNPRNNKEKFKKRFNLIINLIEYYENNYTNPTENELTMILLSGPKGKNKFQIVNKEFRDQELFNKYINDLKNEYLLKRPNISEQITSIETNYDAEDSVNQSESTADMRSFTDMHTTGGKTTVFKNNFNPVLTKTSTIAMKNKSPKNKSENKKLQQFMSELKKRHIDIDFMKSDYQIPVWKPKNKESINNSKRSTKKRNSKTKSKGKNKTRSVKTKK